MNILLMTNTYLPHVGGVARSVASFAAEFRRLGHRVLVIAPEFEPPLAGEEGVLRVPALKHWGGTDFSVPVPTPGFVASAVEQFAPDVVHSHHPFLIGNTALRIAQSRSLPLVFTHHTMYEQYTHYVSGEPEEETPVLTHFVSSLVAGYANLCDTVIAPSRSVADLLRERGVEAPLEVIPTGIDLDRFARGDGAAFRRQRHIPREAFVVGHVGRLAVEKNLEFLAKAVAEFLEREPEAYFLVVGGGPSEGAIRSAFGGDTSQRLIMAGTCQGQELIDAYHAMDLFAFASKSETQGMVLAEAMAAGLPVVALDGPGVREVVEDGVNGRLLAEESSEAFVAALEWAKQQLSAGGGPLRAAALATAEQFSMSRSAARKLALYERVIEHVRQTRPSDGTTWSRTKRRLQAEWSLLANAAQAAGEALEAPPAENTERTP